MNICRRGSTMCAFKCYQLQLAKKGRDFFLVICVYVQIQFSATEAYKSATRKARWSCFPGLIFFVCLFFVFGMHCLTTSYHSMKIVEEGEKMPKSLLFNSENKCVYKSLSRHSTLRFCNFADVKRHSFFLVFKVVLHLCFISKEA